MYDRTHTVDGYPSIGGDPCLGIRPWGVGTDAINPNFNHDERDNSELFQYKMQPRKISDMTLDDFFSDAGYIVFVLAGAVAMYFLSFTPNDIYKVFAGVAVGAVVLMTMPSWFRSTIWAKKPFGWLKSKTRVANA